MRRLPDLSGQLPRPARKATVPLRLCFIAIFGFLYGSLTARNPAPRTDATIFWLGKSRGSLLAHLLSGRGVAYSRCDGLGCGRPGTAAAVAGFYNFLMGGDVTNSPPQHDRSCCRLTVIGSATSSGETRAAYPGLASPSLTD